MDSYNKDWNQHNSDLNNNNNILVALTSNQNS